MSVLVLVLQVAVAQANAVPGQGSSGRTIPGVEQVQSSFATVFMHLFRSYIIVLLSCIIPPPHWPHHLQGNML